MSPSSVVQNTWIRIFRLLTHDIDLRMALPMLGILLMTLNEVRFRCNLILRFPPCMKPTSYLDEFLADATVATEQLYRRNFNHVAVIFIRWTEELASLHFLHQLLSQPTPG